MHVSLLGILVSLALLASSPAFAQLAQKAPAPIPANLRFGRLGVENGVSHSTVWDVLQDRSGFLWLGTESSLQRYDGYELRDFRHDPRDPSSLSSSEVMVQHEEQSGILWFGTRTRGVNRYDPARGTFERFQLRGEVSLTESSESSPLPADIVSEPSGRLWIATYEEGLIRLEPHTRKLATFRAGSVPGSLATDQTNVLFVDSGSRLWVAHALGVDRFDAEQGTFEHFRVEGEPSVIALGESAGRLWAVSGDGGLHFWSGQGFERKASFGTGCFDVEGGEDGSFWCGTYGQGLYYLDNRLENLRVARHQAEDPESLSSDEIWSLHFDRVGLLWISGRNGLSFYNPRRAQFEVARRGRSLPARSVSSMLVDSRDEAWLGSQDGELIRWKPRTNEFRLVAQGFTSSLDSLFEIGEGRVLVADDESLVEVEEKTGKKFRIEIGGLTGSKTALALDPQGRLWVGGTGGLFRLDERRRAIDWPRAGDPGGITSMVYSILVDRSGILWAGGDGGLYRIDPQNFEVKNWRYRPNDASALPNEQVSDLLEDQKGRLWVGTYGGGLALFDRQRETFTRYGASEGLADDFVCSLVEGDRGELWVSTNRGLSRLDLESGEVRNYNSADGLVSDLFLLVSRGKFKDGRIAFGGNQGLTSFYPERLENDPLPPPVVLTELRVGGEVMEPGLAGSPLQQTIVFARRLNLDFRQRSFAIQFAAPHFGNPQKNRYAYRLRGYEEAWTETGAGDRRARYTNLDPGTYTFEVKAANADGVWNEEGTRIEIDLPPAPWQTPLAYSFYVAVGAAALFGYNRWQRRRLEHERAVAAELARLNGELERLVEKRTSEVHQLTGLLPVCSCCKKIRNSEGTWQSIEVYLNTVADVKLSHGLCRDCARDLYPDIDIDQLAG